MFGRFGSLERPRNLVRVCRVPKNADDPSEVDHVLSGAASATLCNVGQAGEEG